MRKKYLLAVIRLKNLNANLKWFWAHGITISKLFQITSPWENWEMKCQSRAEQIFISKTNVLSKKKFPGKQCRNLMKITVGDSNISQLILFLYTVQCSVCCIILELVWKHMKSISWSLLQRQKWIVTYYIKKFVKESQ